MVRVSIRIQKGGGLQNELSQSQSQSQSKEEGGLVWIGFGFCWGFGFWFFFFVSSVGLLCRHQLLHAIQNQDNIIIDTLSL